MPARAPDPRRIDLLRLRALVALQLGQMLRGGVDPSSGVRGHPLRQTALSLGFVGLLFAAGVAQAPSADAFLLRLFFAAFVIHVLVLVPETDDVRERSFEILAAKPVSIPTLVMARGIVLGAVTALVTTSFALPPLLAAAWRFGLGLLATLEHAAMLYAGALALALLWVQVLLVGVGVFGAERLRTTLQLVLVLVILGVTGFSMLSLSGMLPAQLGAGLDALLAAMPSTWFARFASGASLAQQGAVLAVLVVAPALYWYRGLDRYYVALLTSAPRARPARTPWLASALLALSRVPTVGRLLLPPQVLGVASGLLILCRREDLARIRGLLLLLLSLGFFVWALVSDGSFPSLVLVYSATTSGLDGLEVFRQNPQAAAVWIFQKAPLRPSSLVRGLKWAATVRFALPPLGMAAVVLIRLDGPLGGTVLFLGLLVAVRLLMSLALTARPFLPLGQEPRVGQPMVGQALSLTLGLVALLGLGFAHALVRYLGVAGVIVVAVGVVLASGAAVGAHALAVARFRPLAVCP